MKNISNCSLLKFYLECSKSDELSNAKVFISRPQSEQGHHCFVTIFSLLQIMQIFSQKVLIFFLFLHKNICCGYSENYKKKCCLYNICFQGEIRKIFCGYPLLSGALIPQYPIIRYLNSEGTDQLHRKADCSGSSLSV